MQSLIKTTVFGLALALCACGGEQKKDPAAAKGSAKKEAPAAAEKAKAPEEPVETEEEVEAPTLDPRVEQAVTLANKISAEPEAADSILEEAGMDRETFEKLLYEIARDPDLSKSYAVAREA